MQKCQKFNGSHFLKILTFAVCHDSKLTSFGFRTKQSEYVNWGSGKPLFSDILQADYLINHDK